MMDVFELISLITKGVQKKCGPNCYSLIDQDRLYHRVADMRKEGLIDEYILEILTSELIIFVLAQQQEVADFSKLDEADLLKSFDISIDINQEVQNDSEVLQLKAHVPSQFLDYNNDYMCYGQSDACVVTCNSDLGEKRHKSYDIDDSAFQIHQPCNINCDDFYKMNVKYLPVSEEEKLNGTGRQYPITSITSNAAAVFTRNDAHESVLCDEPQVRENHISATVTDASCDELTNIPLEMVMASVPPQVISLQIKGAKPKQKNLFDVDRSHQTKNVTVEEDATNYTGKSSESLAASDTYGTELDVAGKLAEIDQLVAAHVVTLINQFPGFDPAYLTHRSTTALLQGKPFKDLIYELSFEYRKLRVDKPAQCKEGLAWTIIDSCDESKAAYKTVQQLSAAAAMESTSARWVAGALQVVVPGQAVGSHETGTETKAKLKDQLDQVEADALLAHQIDFDENLFSAGQDFPLAHQPRVCDTLKCCSCQVDKPVTTMLVCDEDYAAPHFCCCDCLKRYAERLMVEDKLEFPCPHASCSSKMPDSAIQNVLGLAMFQELLQRRQSKDIMAAGLEGLETCPFCNYSVIIEEKVTANSTNNTVFHCHNDSCGKRSCRLCHKADHFPHKCHQDDQRQTARPDEAIIRSNSRPETEAKMDSTITLLAPAVENAMRFTITTGLPAVAGYYGGPRVQQLVQVCVVPIAANVARVVTSYVASRLAPPQQQADAEES
ncbi:uncharacterized protein LOC108670848 isoform X2 [Hyalella azteca]|uniref:Uncharacterized protein LOC108670848 isoform X2 n=1 Tax=Hyalella azteca TaxID=294128 RepID=A0A8B7NJK9_HYAAZ|nr:uncharacterized protein LOC108670848 isoform X2 [Hyalella azteca]